jgi:hypothetical protein
MARIMQFRQVLGGLSQPSPMIYAFFENGRRQAVIVRIYSGGDADLPADQETASCKAPAWHIKLESAVRYLGIEVDDAPEFAEQTEV